MLKRKLSKTGLICLSLLLMSAANGNTSNHAAYVEDDSTSKKHRSSYSTSHHSFDSSGLCICLNELPEFDHAEAPKVELNAKARKYVNDYLKKNETSLCKIQDKSPRYFRIMDSVFFKANLPLQLKYLSVVESGLKTTALSRVGALGLWQFMPATAKSLGLKRGKKWDERTHTYKSTVAAAKYLKYLYGEFDDWLLTIAAYNSGPGPVYTAIKKSGSRNFWKLQQFLPAETRGHVKRYIAVHEFFESQCSVTVLTKAETEAHVKAVAAFIKKYNEEKEEIISTTTDVNSSR